MPVKSEATSSTKGTKPLYVTARLVSVTTTEGASKQLRWSDVVTEDVSSESVDLLKELGFVSEKSPLDGTND